MEGYKCFMDFEALNCGDFQENLERNLHSTPVREAREREGRGCKSDWVGLVIGHLHCFDARLAVYRRPLGWRRSARGG